MKSKIINLIKLIVEKLGNVKSVAVRINANAKGDHKLALGKLKFQIKLREKMQGNIPEISGRY